MNTFGLLIRREQPSYGGSAYLVAEIVRREGEHHAPRNVSAGMFGYYDNPQDTSLPGHRFADLAMKGHVCDFGEFSFCGYEPEFYGVYSVGASDARAMVRTLDRIGARVKKDAASDPVDVFASVCAALRLSFVVMRCDDGGPDRSSYDDNRWRWMTIGEGRNAYRREIEHLRESERTRKAA